jgi:hypothetical protein
VRLLVMQCWPAAVGAGDPCQASGSFSFFSFLVLVFLS